MEIINGGRTKLRVKVGNEEVSGLDKKGEREEIGEEREVCRHTSKTNTREKNKMK